MKRPFSYEFEREAIVPILGIVAACLLVLNFLTFLSGFSSAPQTRCTAPAQTEAQPWPETIETERLDRLARRAEHDARRAEHELRRLEIRIEHLGKQAAHAPRAFVTVSP